ncbi:MAG: UDP-glucose 4-epimerase GalE [alpha proteobacterium HIMB59]|nr:MAG: UDP-glucose 4-epimerase GalE [alpha proteobacterium HIMB59]|tara:strand:+ start:2736 stop:3713 length:978 start_codon:yes stop_codon:yes gene_type:complete
MKILVVGGAGYIGSHMIKRFQNTDHQIDVLDNLSTGFKENSQNYKLHICDLSNKEQVHKILKENKYEMVMHFASSINVGESYDHPMKYYENNVINTLNLLECMIDLKILNFIFSSTAAVYGEPESIPIKEAQNLSPINPYGKTKSVVENILSDYDKSYGLKYISLRYFNACGAHIDGTIGERHNPETHLIPLILQTASGRRNNFKIYGDDYKTKDGTCVRDYIHVMDIAEAHLLSLEKLIQTQSSDIYNIGNEQGYSVREIIDMVEEITQTKIPYKISEKRKGDPAVLIADNSKITEKLNWRAKYSDLNTIINTAWEWEKKLSNF